MKGILIVLLMTGLLSIPVANSHANTWPWHPKNKKCHVLSEGNVVVEKTKHDRIVRKRYKDGAKVEETTTYASGHVDHKFKFY